MLAVSERHEHDHPGASASHDAAVGHLISAISHVHSPEAESLYLGFMDHCSDFVLVHDVARDTFTSMRGRSAACLLAAMAVYAGASGADYGTSRRPSALAREGEDAVQSTLFARKASRWTIEAYHILQWSSLCSLPIRLICQIELEDVQAVITLGVYHPNYWLILGHAIRLATLLGCDIAMEQVIAPDRIPPREDIASREAERILLAKARVWFALYAHEAQTGFGNGRMPNITSPPNRDQCRRFVDHELCISSDIRLVAVVELLVLRTTLQPSLSGKTQGNLVDVNSLMDSIRRFSTKLEEWYLFYDSLMATRLGLSTGSYYRESLLTQREYANLFVKSLLLRDIRDPSDVRSLSDDAYMLALSSARSAQTCLNIVLRGRSYPSRLRYAIPHTHLSVVSAATFLHRTARLFSDRLDIQAISQDVCQLADLLNECGAGYLAKYLRSLSTTGHPTLLAPALLNNRHEAGQLDVQAPTSGGLVSTQSSEWMPDAFCALDTAGHLAGGMGQSMPEEVDFGLFFNNTWDVLGGVT